MSEIPLRNRAGEVIAVAIVDEEDFERLNQRRWCYSHGYAVRGTEVGGVKRHHRMHREILGLKHGDGVVVDHIDGNPLNNRRSNLRTGTQAENMQNRRNDCIGRSRHRGVVWQEREQKWRAQVTVNYRQRSLGYFDDEEEAAAAVAAYRAEHLPFSPEASRV